jgi:hypothetical protein
MEDIPGDEGKNFRPCGRGESIFSGRGLQDETHRTLSEATIMLDIGFLTALEEVYPRNLW